MNMINMAHEVELVLRVGHCAWPVPIIHTHCVVSGRRGPALVLGAHDLLEGASRIIV